MKFNDIKPLNIEYNLETQYMRTPVGKAMATETDKKDLSFLTGLSL